MQINLRAKTARLGFISGVAIAVGFIFHILLARKFGVSRQLDCYFVVLALFGWLALFNTFLAGLYIPIFNEVKKESLKSSLIFADVVIKCAVLISILIILLVLMFDSLIIRLIAPGFTQENLLLTMQLNRVLMPALVFFSISYAVILTLNALYYYALPALVQLLDPLLNILALFFLVPRFGIKGIALSHLLSNFLKATILLLYLYIKTGWRPTLNFYHSRLPELIKRSSQISVSGMIWGLRDIILRNFASRIGEGAVTLFSYAQKIIDIVVRVVIAPLARVFYTRVSELIASCEWQKVRGLFIRATRVNVGMNLFISAFLVVFLSPLLSLLFLNSKFSLEDIGILSMLVNAMLIFFVVSAVGEYFSRVALSLKKVKTVIINTLLGITALFISILLLSDKFEIFALPMAVSFAQIVICVLYYFFARKLLDLSFIGLIREFSSGFLVSILFVVIGLIARNFVTDNLMMILIVLPLWVIAYLLAARIFMKEEIKILLPGRNK